MPLNLEVKKKSLSSRSLRVIFAALILSVLGHLVLFFGIPFWSPLLPIAVSDKLIIKTDLLLELPKKIKLANAMGNCFGVRNAIKAALQEKNKGNLTILGQLVHNPQTVNKLLDYGIYTTNI